MYSFIYWTLADYTVFAIITLAVCIPAWLVIRGIRIARDRRAYSYQQH